jgi:hypothetical protein
MSRAIPLLRHYALGGLLYGELYFTFTSPDIVRVIKTSRILGVGHVARRGEVKGVDRRPERKADNLNDCMCWLS